MTLEEAKTTAAQGDRAEIGKVREALDVLYAEIRKHETAPRLSVAMPDGRTALAVNEVVQELLEATETHGPLRSAHEGLGVMMEEFDELKEWVYLKECKRDPIKGRAEAKQIAAIAVRFMLDACDPKPERCRCAELLAECRTCAEKRANEPTASGCQGRV